MKGIDLVKHFEGLRLDAYLCPAGIPTIGYGHTHNVRLGQRINLATANLFLEHDFEAAEAQVQTLVRVPLKIHQLEALASFVFNLGAGRLKGSTLLRKLNTGNYTGAADEFDKWIKAGGKILPGLVKRRAAEKRLFLGEQDGLW